MWQSTLLETSAYIGDVVHMFWVATKVIEAFIQTTDKHYLKISMWVFTVHNYIVSVFCVCECVLEVGGTME